MGRKAQISKEILTAIGVVGILVVGLAVPNALVALKPFLPNSKNYNLRKFNNSLNYLKNYGLISMGKEGDKTIIKLTKEGRQRIFKYNLDDMQILKPKRWDNKWRMVIFDIPEKIKVNRIMFARKLKEIGFYQLQRSVWICPYPCEDEVEFLKVIFQIRPFVRIAVVEKIDYSKELYKHFHLA